MCMMHQAGSSVSLSKVESIARVPEEYAYDIPLTMGFGRKVFSVHNHVGHLEPWPFYESEVPVSPADPGPATAEELDHFMKCRGMEKTLIIPNYGIPVQAQPFSHNELVVRLCRQGGGKVAGALWVSGLPQNRELTENALTLLEEPGIAALKMSYLLGGTADPRKWMRRRRSCTKRFFGRRWKRIFRFISIPARAGARIYWDFLKSSSGGVRS